MFVGDATALDPALHSGMIAMAQLASHRADATAFADDFCVGHKAYVRSKRTMVNVENILGSDEYGWMAENHTMGQRLRGLREQSGLSLDEVAKRAGYRTKSGAQRYFEAHYDTDFLPRSVAEKLADAFEATPVGREPIMALAGLPEVNAVVQKLEGASQTDMRRDVPVYGTALGAPRDFDGVAVEQTMLNTGEVIEYLPRPVALNRVNHVYALYVQGESMCPRFEDGETIFATDGKRARPPKNGDDVVVYLRDHHEDDGERASGVMVKRLRRKTGNFYELEQFQPALQFKVPVEKVLKIDRVLPWSEILS